MRQALQQRAARLGRPAIDGAEASIEDGYACHAGLPRCTGGWRAQMVVVDEHWDEAERRGMACGWSRESGSSLLSRRAIHASGRADLRRPQAGVLSRDSRLRSCRPSATALQPSLVSKR
jgi:hypothetical protein